MHGAVALACYEQFVPSECHVHRLRTDLDRRLAAKRWVYQTHRVAVQTGDANQAIVWRVTRDLRRLWHILEDHLVADTAGFGVYQKQGRLRIVDCDHGASIGRDSDASEGARRLNLAEQFSFRQVDNRNCAILLVLSIEPLAVRRDDQAVAVRRAGVDGVDDLMRLGINDRDDRAILANDIDQTVKPELQRVQDNIRPEIDITDMGAHGEVDDAKHVAGIGVATVYSVAEDGHIGEAGVRHYEQLMHRAGKTFEHDFRLVGNGIEKQHFCADLVDRDHPARVFSAGHRFFPWSWATIFSASFWRKSHGPDLRRCDQDYPFSAPARRAEMGWPVALPISEGETGARSQSRDPHTQSQVCRRHVVVDIGKNAFHLSVSLVCQP